MRITAIMAEVEGPCGKCGVTHKVQMPVPYHAHVQRIGEPDPMEFAKYLCRTCELPQPAEQERKPGTRNISIMQLGVSLWAEKILKKNNIHTVGDYLALSETAVRNIHGFGSSRRREVDRAVADLGFELVQERADE